MRRTIGRRMRELHCEESAPDIVGTPRHSFWAPRTGVERELHTSQQPGGGEDAVPSRGTSGSVTSPDGQCSRSQLPPRQGVEECRFTNSPGSHGTSRRVQVFCCQIAGTTSKRHFSAEQQCCAALES